MKSSPRPRRRWVAEPLESRLLLSADTPAADVLQIIGTEAADSALIRTVESPTGETAQLFVVLNGASFEYTIAAGQKILIDLLDGNDKLDARISVDAEWDIELGEGDDQIFIEALIGDLSADQHYRVRGGEGDNTAEVVFGDGETGRRLPPARTNIVAEYQFGSGDDNVNFDWQVQLERPLHLVVAFDFGAGNDSGTMAYGGGGGAGKADFHDFTLNSGLGDDALKISLAGVLGEVDLTVDAGEGNDTVQSNIHAVWLTVGNFNVDGGDGDDAIELCAEVRVEPEPLPVALAANLNVDAGEGNDKVKVKWFDNVPTEHVELDVRVGQAESFLPEVGDEVLIAFEGGDFSAPIIIGALWNGSDKPPETQGEAPARKFHVSVDTALPAVQAELTIELSDQKDNLVLDFAGILGAQVKAHIESGGLLNLLTLFPLGSLELSQAIEDDRRGHSSADIDFLMDAEHLSALIRTGAADDSLAITPEQTSRFFALVDFNGGAGMDRVRVDTSDLDVRTIGSFSEVSGLDSENSAVDYREGVEAGDLNLQIDLSGLESLILKTGSHNDEVRVDVDHPQSRMPNLDICTSDGDDTITASFIGVLSEVVFNLDGGDGDDTVDVKVVESNTVITGTGASAGPHVKAFSGASATETSSFFAYSASFTGGVRVATGDINGDGVADIVTGAGPGAGPHVKVFDGRDNSELRSFFAYGPSFAGGVFVAAGDINGDGLDDIITGAGSGAGPHVKVFDGGTGTEIRSFFAYAPTFVGGVRVAAGDVNGDGRADIITATGPGAGPHVKVFDGVSGAEIRSFFAYDANFRGGVFVAAGDFNGDNVADIVTGTDTGGAPLVKVFNGPNLAALRSFSAYAPGFMGGVRVAVGDVNGDGHDDIITGAGPGEGPHVKAFDGQSGGLLRSFFPYDPDFRGGVFVAASDVGHAGVFDLNVDAGAGDDRVAVEFITGSPRADLIGVDMGTGADNVELVWKGALQDPSAEQKIHVQVNLGGMDPSRLSIGDVVQTTFIGGDPDRPFISGFIWNSEDSSTADTKSLSMEMTSTNGILEASSQLTGGMGADTMQLFFQGKLKVTGTAAMLTVINLGGGDDELVVGTVPLEPEGPGKAEPIAIDVQGGVGEDKLIVNGTNGADEIAVTDLSVIVYANRTVQYSGFECLHVNALAGDDNVTMTSINPRTKTVIDGGPGRDKFTGRFDGDFVGELHLLNFEQSSIKVRGRTVGSITSDEEEA
jgi:hypothetical protein